MTDEPREEASEEEDELEAQLKEIDERVQNIRGSKKLPEVPEWEFKRPVTTHEQNLARDAESYRGLGVGIMLAYAMIGPIIVGWGIGWLIDRGSKSNAGTTWGTVIGMFAGFLAVVVLLNRANQQSK